MNPLDGPPAMVRLGLMNVLGYTLGREGKRNCPPADWTSRASLHLRVVMKGRGPAVSLDEVARVVGEAWATSRMRRSIVTPTPSPTCAAISPSALPSAAGGGGATPTGNGICDKPLMLQTKRLGTF